MNQRPVALVFCGGSGKRLRPLTYLMRKEMLPIGRQRKPLLEYIVNHLRRSGFDEIVFLHSKNQSDDIANYFGDGSRFGVEIRHQSDPDGCQGTGHALLGAIKSLDLHERVLLLYYGDMLTNVDLRNALTRHRSQNAAATLILSDSYILPKGVALLDKTGAVKALREKPPWDGPGKIGIGILFCDAGRLLKVLSGAPLPEILRSNESRDVMKDLVPKLIQRDKVTSYITDQNWLDIGSF